MYPASGLLFSDGSGVKKPLRAKTFEAVFFCSFSGSGIDFHLLEESIKCIPPIGKRSKTVSGKL